ncbi:MAG: SDR family NAD(P)-dependent oxidoreductase [Pseudomonadota bacterium]
MSNDLEGRVAIVTGFAINIGRETCLKLAGLGAAVITHAKKNAVGAHETAAPITAAGAQAGTYVGDLSDPMYAQELIDTAVRQFGGLHILVDNAAMRRNTALAGTSDEDWQAIIKRNLDARFLCTKTATPI